MTVGADLVRTALKFRGHPYKLGAELNGVPINTVLSRKLAFDCSELVEYVCHQHGIKMVDGAQNQRNFCRNAGTLISPSKARNIPGALGFIIRGAGQTDHVVISLGNGSTMEAANKKKGCGVFNWDGRGFTHAALIPGVKYPGVNAPAVGTPQLDKEAQDLLALVMWVVFLCKATIKDDGPLVIGDKRKDVVAAVQKGINGYLVPQGRSIRTDGVYDQETANVVRFFQLVWGLNPTGAVDLATANKIWP